MGALEGFAVGAALDAAMVCDDTASLGAGAGEGVVAGFSGGIGSPESNAGGCSTAFVGLSVGERVGETLDAAGLGVVVYFE